MRCERFSRLNTKRLEVNCANWSLTDYIRQDFEVHLGDPEAQFTQLGVLSYFESIRRGELKASNSSCHRCLQPAASSSYR